MKARKHPKINNWSRSVLMLSVLLFAVAELLLAVAPIPDPPPFLRERFACRVWPGIPPVETSIVNWQVANSINHKRKTDVLLLGDSSCLMGLKPEIIQKETGLSCWNLGTVGVLGTDGHALMLDFWVKHHGAPRCLVYHIVPYCLMKKTADTQLWGNMLRDWMAAGEKKDLADSLPTGIARRFVLYQLSNIASSFGSENERVNKPRGHYPSDLEVASILRKNQGWMPEYNPATLRQKWKCEKFEPFHPDCVEGLNKIFEISKRYNFPVLLVMHDVPDVYPRTTTAEAYKGYEQALTAVAKPYPNVHLADPFFRTLPTELCASLNHVTPAGAVIHSREIANVLKAMSRNESQLATLMRQKI